MNEPNIIRINLDEASRTELNRLPRVHEGDSGIKLQLYTAEGFYAGGDVVADFDTKTVSYRKTVDFYGQIEVPDELLADECCGDIHIHLTIENYDDLDFVCYDFVMPVVRIIHYDRFEPTPPVPPVDPWPAGFDRLEYIQSEGDVYLDTEVSVRDWDMNFRLTLLCEIFGTGYNGIGSYSANYDWGFWCPSYGNGVSYMRSTYGYSNWGTYPDDGQKRYRFMDAGSGYNNFGYTIGVSSFAEYADSEGYPNAKGNIYVFAMNHWKTDEAHFFLRERVYEIQFRNSTTWADFTDMYPVRRKRDGAIGFYSVAERKFLTAKGAGRFLPGPTYLYDIILPSDYKKVLYIESNNAGRTGAYYAQKVDTGVPFDDVKKIRLEEDFNIIAEQPATQWGTFIGRSDNFIYGVEYYTKTYWVEPKMNDFFVGIGSTDGDMKNFDSQVDTKAMTKLVLNGHDGYVEVNGIRENCVTKTPAECNSPLASSSYGTPTIPVFAVCEGLHTFQQDVDTRVYRFRIYDYDLGAYRVDLIPCYRKSDHQPGFYDIVNNVFRYDEDNASVGVYAAIGETYD